MNVEALKSEADKSHGRVSQAVATWLTPLKFVGMAVLLSGIAVALLTIVKVLRWQTGRLVEIAQGK